MLMDCVFLKTAAGDAIRMDLINRVFIEDFKVYGATATSQYGVILLDARSTEECEKYIERITPILDVTDVAKGVVFKARSDIYEYVLNAALTAKTDEECKFDTLKLKDFFKPKYRSDLIQDAVNDLHDHGYVENFGYSSNVGHHFGVMAHPSFKAVQWMLNNLFFYYSVGYERTYDEIFTRLRSTKEVGHRWPKFADHHTKMVIQAMKETGYLIAGKVQAESLIIKDEPKGEYNDDDEFTDYNVTVIRDATLMMEAKDYVVFDDDGYPLFDTVKDLDSPF